MNWSVLRKCEIYWSYSHAFRVLFKAYSPGFNCLISFASVFSYMYSWVLNFVYLHFISRFLCTNNDTSISGISFVQTKHQCVLIQYCRTLKAPPPPRNLCSVFVFAILYCLFFAALWSPAWKGLIYWFSGMWCFLCFYHFHIWCPGSDVVHDCTTSWYKTFLLFISKQS